ncbi:MAG: hypothetical protein AAFN79_05710 [Pseudomonadota bacterium]
MGRLAGDCCDMADELETVLTSAARPVEKAAAAARAMAAEPERTAAALSARLPAVIPRREVQGEAARGCLALIAEAAAAGQNALARALAILMRERVAPLRADGPAAQVMKAARLTDFDDPWVVATVGRAAFATGQLRIYERASAVFRARAPYWRDPLEGEGVRRLLLINRQPRIEGAERWMCYNHSNLPNCYVEEKGHPRLAIDVLTLRDLDHDAVRERIVRPDFVMNNIGVPELIAREGWGPLIERIADDLGAPLLNPPGLMADLGRAANYRRIGEGAHYLFPKTVDGASLEAELSGLRFPVIVRDQVSHMGAEMILARDEAELRAAMDRFGAAATYVIEYHDCRQADGLYHRYRICKTGDAILPARIHCAKDWNVHGNEHDALKEAEPEYGLAALEAQFWDRPLELIPEPVWNALGEMLRETGLDVVGCDFTMMPDGRALIFEVNPSMHLNLRDYSGFERLLGLA